MNSALKFQGDVEGRRMLDVRKKLAMLPLVPGLVLGSRIGLVKLFGGFEDRNCSMDISLLSSWYLLLLFRIVRDMRRPKDRNSSTPLLKV